MQFRKQDIFTIPNIMCYFRILLVPVFVVVYLKFCNTLSGRIASMAIVAISGLTDVFDGKVARALGQVTDLGKILDPIADKAMQFAMMFCVVLRYRLVVILLTVYALKEIVSLIFSTYLFNHDKNIGGAQWWGKICTVILYCEMLIFVLIPGIGHPVDIIMISVSGFFMLLAFVMYMRSYIKLLVELKNERNQ